MSEVADIWCPVCDAGWVEHVRIEPGTHEGMLCAECEAFWEEGAAPDAGEFMQFSSWIREQEIPPDELQVLRGQGV